MLTGKNTAMLLSALLTIMSASSTAALAQTWARQHPRRAEVLRRDNNLNNRINNNVGHLSGQYGHLERQDGQIRQQEQADARRNGGFITRGQQTQLNREENVLGQETRFDNTNNRFVQNHPARAEVLARDANLNYAINKDQGHLEGQYGQLMSEDHSIVRQEHQDARANGGYITSAQRMQLNQEETGLRNQIRQDYSGSGIQPAAQAQVQGQLLGPTM